MIIQYNETNHLNLFGLYNKYMGKSETSEIEKLEDNVEETVESEMDFQSYIEDKREEKVKKDIEDELNSGKSTREAQELGENSIDKEYSLNDNTDIGLYQARVNKVKFLEDKFILTLEDKDGENFTYQIDAGLPEDTSSDWTRLCEWVDADPSRPTELRGEIVPITRDYDTGPRVRIPPVKKRLNPVAFMLKRAFGKGIIRIAENDIYLMILGGIMFVLPYLLTFASYEVFQYSGNIVQTTTGMEEYLGGFLMFLSFVVLVGSFLASVAATFIVSKVGLLFIFRNYSRVTSPIYRFLFPKE